MTSWVNDLKKDWGWGITAFAGAESLTPDKYKILKNKLLDPGLVARSDGNVYIFLTGMNIWCNLVSKQTAVFINSLLDQSSASVNYINALEPYAPMIERESSDKISLDIPTSICIGTERLRVSLMGNGLKLSRCESVLPHLPTSKHVLASLCYMPLSIRLWPSEWQRSMTFNMYKFLSPLFVDPIEYKTVEWAIGNALIDPHSYSKTVVLYGSGGHGKSTFINSMHTILMGCCGVIPDSALMRLDAGVSPYVASIVASNRVVTAGDVGGDNRNTNLTVIKSLTGHDYLPIPPSQVRTACTLFYATNTLDDPLDNPEWCTAQIMRRVVVVLMNANIMEDFSGRIPQDTISKLDFIMGCIHTRLSYPNMPVNIMSVLLTIMGSRFDMVCKYITVVTDDDGFEDEVIVANAIVSGCMAKEVSHIANMAERISRSSIILIGGHKYIGKIVPSEFYQYD